MHMLLRSLPSPGSPQGAKPHLQSSSPLFLCGWREGSLSASSIKCSPRQPRRSSSSSPLLLTCKVEGISRFSWDSLFQQELVSRGNEGSCRAMAGAVASAVESAEEKEGKASSRVAVLINGGSGKMGQSVAQAAVAAGIHVLPVALAGPQVAEHTVEINGLSLRVVPAELRDEVLDEALAKHPGLIIVDYTLPAAVNGNAEWYCQRGVPFVMGTTGGDRARLLSGVAEAGNYAVIAAQMGKQVVAFMAAMEALADACPGAFNGYTLTVTESHQSSKVDTSGTAKDVVAALQKLLGEPAFDVNQIEMVRDPAEQVARMGVPSEHLLGHAFHTYRLTSADGTVTFEFQHNVCGRSIYAEGTVDAVFFLAKKIEEKSEQRLYTMKDVLREGFMR
eukprot:TRINITY_DN21001_c0_g1_i1.p1 TRINITY_DN21001_c0_g1~~TRINITY_DN21001_c0_g1_i1.p1  ORF type:complete len:391 (-),score=71.00 TRINITY_DN21001_c0_g1_i1:228-1400(-)